MEGTNLVQFRRLPIVFLGNEPLWCKITVKPLSGYKPQHKRQDESSARFHN